MPNTVLLKLPPRGTHAGKGRGLSAGKGLADNSPDHPGGCIRPQLRDKYIYKHRPELGVASDQVKVRFVLPPHNSRGRGGLGRG